MKTRIEGIGLLGLVWAGVFGAVVFLAVSTLYESTRFNGIADTQEIIVNSENPVEIKKIHVESIPELIKGGEYEVYLGGSATGTATDGLYQGGTYTPGTKLKSFTAPAS